MGTKNTSPSVKHTRSKSTGRTHKIKSTARVKHPKGRLRSAADPQSEERSEQRALTDAEAIDMLSNLLSNDPGRKSYSHTTMQRLFWKLDAKMQRVQELEQMLASVVGSSLLALQGKNLTGVKIKHTAQGVEMLVAPHVVRLGIQQG